VAPNRPALGSLLTALLVSLLLPALALSQGAPGVTNQGGTESAPQANAIEQQELRRAIDSASNDRAALLRNLEGFLKKYPESAQRPQIYRAIVEASVQLRDFPRALDYSERLVALKPDDISNTILTIQLIEGYGDAPGWRRGISYCGRVLVYVAQTSVSDKSPRVSAEDWENARKRDRSSILLTRGHFYQKLNDFSSAQKDYEVSYALFPSSMAAERLGELAELRKDLNAAIQEYALAFALSDGTGGGPTRIELRKKIGNVWRLAHGSEDGLGQYLLRAFDDASNTVTPAKAPRNQSGKEPYDFILRKVPGGSPVPFADTRGKILVLNFWATWCGPCRAMEPHFDKIAQQYAGHNDVLFYALNCDDDESLVMPYLEEEKPKATVLFADGLDKFLQVYSFPTTVILDRTGKIAFRSEGFDYESVDKLLTEAIERTIQTAAATSPASAAAKP
jgi:thiol-disulfide isomerase/thioredoxin